MQAASRPGYSRVADAARNVDACGVAPLTGGRNVNGQRYIGTGIKGNDLKIEVHGTPGQDMAMFMDGPTLEVFGNAQDGVGNTMNAGTVIVHGSAGDVLGYGMRGGTVYLRGDVEPWQVGKECGIFTATDEEMGALKPTGGPSNPV